MCGRETPPAGEWSGVWDEIVRVLVLFCLWRCWGPSDWWIWLSLWVVGNRRISVATYVYVKEAPGSGRELVENFISMHLGCFYNQSSVLSFHVFSSRGIWRHFENYPWIQQHLHESKTSQHPHYGLSLQLPIDPHLIEPRKTATTTQYPSK